MHTPKRTGALTNSYPASVFLHVFRVRRFNFGWPGFFCIFSSLPHPRHSHVCERVCMCCVCVVSVNGCWHAIQCVAKPTHTHTHQHGAPLCAVESELLRSGSILSNGTDTHTTSHQPHREDGEHQQQHQQQQHRDRITVVSPPLPQSRPATDRRGTDSPKRQRRHRRQRYRRQRRVVVVVVACNGFRIPIESVDVSINT